MPTATRPLRVAGTDPGTSSLDMVVLEDGLVIDQVRFEANELAADPAAAVHWLERREPFALVAGPSGYGLPLVRREACGERELALMSLVRPDERDAGGVLGFTRLLREMCASSLPLVFLPGVIHLPTVPAHRKLNRIDLGTTDKLCVAALALAVRAQQVEEYSACVVELGSAFTACVVLKGGQIVDGVGGTAGPVGWASGGAWDGETAYLLSPLGKRDLFCGGARSASDGPTARRWFRESLTKAVAGLRAVTDFAEVVLSGRLLETQPELAAEVAADLGRWGHVVRLGGLPGAWVKQAAQGSALLADGLAGGRYAKVVESLKLDATAGTVLDGLVSPRADDVRGWFVHPARTGKS